MPLSSAAGENALSVLWARERIGALMDQLRSGAPEAEIRAAVLKLSLEHQLVSRYASLVAVDKTPARRADALLKSASLATNLPEGWVYEGVFGELPRGATGMAPRKRLTLAAALVLALAGAIYLGLGGYIYLKAQLGQVLIERAWQRALAGDAAPRPWPWADTWPVARLEAPAQGVSLFVLSGSSGRTLAFGPGHQQGTPAPGARGNSVIGGHRDTHLAFLEKITLGDPIRVQRADGVHVHYRVTQLDVLDKGDTWVTRNDGGTRLTLITCWPFDALRAGGDKRYVVIADPTPTR